MAGVRAVLLLVLVAAASCAQDSYRETLDRARTAFRGAGPEEGIETATRAIGLRPDEALGYLVRAAMREASGDGEGAIEDMDRADELGAGSARFYNRRGESHFRLAHIDESIADFDRVIEAEPAQAPHHWQRGISLYYAARYADCRAQFEQHQTVNPHDVENGAWHFLCAARASSFEQARKALLPIEGDGRRPMAEVYRMYRGELTPEEVLAAAEQAGDDRARFYAHLYIGLFFEARGEVERSAEHIRRAAELAQVGGYMGDVALVHAKLRGPE